MTRRVSGAEQGELQGAISSLRSVAIIIGPALFAFTFAYFINAKKGWNLPGIPWYLAGALLFLAMLFSLRIRSDKDRNVADLAPEIDSVAPPSI